MGGKFEWRFAYIRLTMSLDWISTGAMAAAIELMRNALAHTWPGPLIDITCEYMNDHRGQDLIFADHRLRHIIMNDPEHVDYGIGNMCGYFTIYFYRNGAIYDAHHRDVSAAEIWDFVCGELPSKIRDLLTLHSCEQSAVDNARVNLRERVSKAASAKK
jgi:hypothetical protein